VAPRLVIAASWRQLDLALGIVIKWPCRSILRSSSCGKLLDCQTRCADQRPESSSRNFPVIGDRKSGSCAFFYEDDVSRALAGDVPTEFFKGTNHLASGEQWKLRHSSSVGRARLQGNTKLLDSDFDL
jgi:hypothetical protein